LKVCGLAEVGDPQVGGAHAVEAGKERNRLRVAVEHGHHGAGLVIREDCVEDPVLGSVVSASGSDAEGQVGAGDADELGPEALFSESFGGVASLGGQGTHHTDRHGGLRGGP